MPYGESEFNMTVKEWISQAEARLKRLEVESASLEAQLLAAHVLYVDRTWLFAHPEAEFNVLAGEHVLARRLNWEPLGYILGWREFFGRNFGVDRSVLIPRQETETLVEAALRYFPAETNPIDPVEISLLDMGTGSGAIAVTLSLERPNWNVTAVDVSAEALATASANGKFHGAAARFVLSDAFEGLLGESFDLILSNPPYIGNSETIPNEVREFEPPIALFAENNGLAFFQRLAREAPAYLNDGGILAIEIGHRQDAEVTEIFQNEGWTPFDRVKDLSEVTRVLAFTHRFDLKGDRFAS
jgi:release factor glutamine methyltransferase